MNPFLFLRRLYLMAFLIDFSYLLPYRVYSVCLLKSFCALPFLIAYVSIIIFLRSFTYLLYFIVRSYDYFHNHLSYFFLTSYFHNHLCVFILALLNHFLYCSSLSSFTLSPYVYVSLVLLIFVTRFSIVFLFVFSY